MSAVTLSRAPHAPHRARAPCARANARNRQRWGWKIASKSSMMSDDADAAEAPALAFDDGTPLIKIKRKAKSANATVRAGIEPPKVMASRARILRDAASEASSHRSDESDEYGVNAMDVVERDVAVPDFRDSAGVLRWMVKTTDEMLDDMEAREPPTAVAAWEISKRAEAVASNPAVRGTADVVGKVSVAAVRAAAPVMAQGATKAIQEGGKFAVKAVVRAAAAKAGFETTKKDKERDRAREDAAAATKAKAAKAVASSSSSSSSTSSSNSPAGNAAARVLGALGGKKKTPAPETPETKPKKRFFSL